MRLILLLLLVVLTGCSLNNETLSANDKNDESSSYINYPTDINTIDKKIQYSFRAEEVLRIEHNEKGKLYRDGKISQKEWDDYLINTFEPKSVKISGEVAKLREELGYTLYKQGTVEFNEQAEKEKQWREASSTVINLNNILK